MTYKKLPKKFKEKWLKALRGGEYKQGDGNLYDHEDRYCCLGVGCHVQGVSRKKLMGEGCPHRNIKGVPGYFINMDSESILIDMNDSTGEHRGKKKSFKQIANWISKNL